ncbi:hypothetical protein EI555_000876 [Monodon monoceros]|uniref:Calpain catalytic domain-containing protein n=1 Tax=Monodon monoceros TaxID=40151 RepID=A0A4U1EFX7_MONMO|nr:hypothetical protein EI555_000876 [Monodon monoceros]
MAWISPRCLQHLLLALGPATWTGSHFIQATSKHGPAYLVKLRNPWGRVEWKGDWSDSSSMWELLSLTEKILLLRKDDDGEFWMTLQDFKAHFMLLVICKLSPGLLNQEVVQKWSYTMLEGRWEKGTTAGGPTKSPRDTFWKNPKFLLSVWRPQEGRRFQMPCSVLVSLLRKPRHRHRNKKPHLAIGFYLFRVGGPLVDQISRHIYSTSCGVPAKVPVLYPQSYDDQRRLPPKFFWKNAPLNWPATFLREKEVSRELWLEPGTYVIVPCTSESHQESEFILRVFSRKRVFYEIGRSSSVIFPKPVTTGETGMWVSAMVKHLNQHSRGMTKFFCVSVPIGNCRPNGGQDEFFTQLFEKMWERPFPTPYSCGPSASNEPSAVMILFYHSASAPASRNKCSPTAEDPEPHALGRKGPCHAHADSFCSFTGLRSEQPLFSLEACQGILALLDVSFWLNASGTVSIQEFRDPWTQLMLCQEVFHKQDTNCSGCLNWAQLRAAMRDTGIVLSDDVCQLMLIRYGSPDLQMAFVSFVR